MNTMVNVRMSKEMLTQVETVAKARGYLTTQEYMREAIRQDMEKYIKKELDALIASGKKVKAHHLTREERDTLAERSLSRKLTPTEKRLLRNQ